METTLTVTMEEAVSHAANFDESLALIIQQMLANKRQLDRHGFEYLDFYIGKNEACLIMLQECLNRSAKAVISQKKRESTCLTITH